MYCGYGSGTMFFTFQGDTLNRNFLTALFLAVSFFLPSTAPAA